MFILNLLFSEGHHFKFKFTVPVVKVICFWVLLRQSLLKSYKEILWLASDWKKYALPSRELKSNLCGFLAKWKGLEFEKEVVSSCLVTPSLKSQLNHRATRWSWEWVARALMVLSCLLPHTSSCDTPRIHIWFMSEAFGVTHTFLLTVIHFSPG